MKFYHFHQNNSGGSFRYDDKNGIGENVYIEARDAKMANALAECTEIYFDGVDKGRDCECCGDRWHPVYEGDANEQLPTDPDDYNAFVHYLDGRIEKL